MEAIKLTKNQEVQSIRMEPADNGGCVLRYTIYTPSKQHSDSKYDDKVEVYTDAQIEGTVMPRIMELYKADYANAMTNHATKNAAPPMEAKAY